MSSADESSDFEIYDEDATMSGRTPEEDSSCREDILPYVSYYDALQNHSTTGDNGHNGGPKRLSLNWPAASSYYGGSDGNGPEADDQQQQSASFESSINSTTSTAVPLSKRRRSSKQECFIEKLYKMATCDAHASVFGFSDDGSYIEIRTPSGLAQVLNQYFKHSNSSSFIRQLNNYGFKTMSSVSTGKNIQCFSHPQFRRGAPEDLAKITRKTAKILKKCKREIIKDLQTGEAACRKRVKELEQLNARLEREVARLEQQNAALVREIAMRDHNASSQQQQQQQLLLQQDVTMIGSQSVQNPVLTSNASSYSSSLVDAMDVSQTHQLLSTTPSRMLSPIHYQQPLLIQPPPPPQHLSYSSSASLGTSTSSSSSSDHDSQTYFSSTRPLPTNNSIDSLESYYFEPVLEMVSDYSDHSPVLANNYRVDNTTHSYPSGNGEGGGSGEQDQVLGESSSSAFATPDKDHIMGDYQMTGSSSSSSSSNSHRNSPEVSSTTPARNHNNNNNSSRGARGMVDSSSISPA